MSKMIQIRNVPDELHRRLKVRAAERGLTLSSYLLKEMERIGSLPTREEWVARLRSHEAVDLDSAETVRIIRSARDAEDPRGVR